MSVPYQSDVARSFGLAPPQHVTAAQMLQQRYPRVGIQPMPPGAPGRVTPDKLGVHDSEPLKFVVIGDSGGVKDAEFQNHVAAAMVGRLVDDQSIAFCYHVGDEVYFNGDPDQYAPQFYEPYSHFNRPIVGIPGNHDGDVAEDDAGNQTGRQPLDTFMANFCDQTPRIPTADSQFEYGRHTQTQPYCDWTLHSQAATIIGLYSNVPSGGHLYDQQVSWLTGELKAVPSGVPLIVSLHHPPYSIDAHHGGSVHMGEALDSAFAGAERYPNMVLSGHVHDYQRFTRSVAGHDIVYVVIGNSGYHNLHALASDAETGMTIPADDGSSVMFEYGDASRFGFIVLSVHQGTIEGEYVAVDRDGSVIPNADAFTA